LALHYLWYLMAHRKHKILNSIDRLGAEEESFMKRHFLAPVVRGHGVRVRIANVICRMKIEPADYQGWGVFLPITMTEAMLDRPASMSERTRYLALLPSVRMIVCRKHESQAFVVPANPSDPRCQSSGMLELRLADEIELFDTIVSRFDGSMFWFDRVDETADPSMAAYLRESLTREIDPQMLERKGLTTGQRYAYALNHAARRAELKLSEAQQREARLRDALTHAGADLRDFSEMHDDYRVTFVFDGRRHTSLIGKRDLTVRSAGICLSGMDSEFDLNSLVGVLREAGRR
jgi:hypothetical protein